MSVCQSRKMYAHSISFWMWTKSDSWVKCQREKCAAERWRIVWQSRMQEIERVWGRWSSVVERSSQKKKKKKRRNSRRERRRMIFWCYFPEMSRHYVSNDQIFPVGFNPLCFLYHTIHFCDKATTWHSVVQVTGAVQLIIVLGSIGVRFRHKL